MTDLPTWRLERHVARLQVKDLRLDVHVDQPSLGLTNVSLGGGSLPSGRLMQLRIPGLEGTLPTSSITESYVRGADLIGSYATVTQSKLRSQVYWQGRTYAQAVGLEVLISIQTDLLDTRPAVETVSSLTAAQLWQGDVEAAHFERIEPTGQLVSRANPAGPLLLYRSDRFSHSYLEMVYPWDLDEQWIRVADDRAENGFRLLHEHLEKGVIRRLRLAGWFLPREDDARLAFELYRQMLHADPPLTT